MTVALLLIGDGRDRYRSQALDSLVMNVDTRGMPVVEVDDRDHKLGFAGAVQHGWTRVLAETHAEWVLWLELDFTFNQRVPVQDILDVLTAHPQLTQMALLRQPVNAAERAAGGIVQQNPDAYTPREWRGHQWLESTRCFTTNPCIVPRWVLERGWPQRPESEGHFGIDLFGSDPALRSAYWGAGEEWVCHIGDERAGTGY